MSVRIQEGAKLFASVEGAKLHHTKINLYTIFTYTMVKMYPNTVIHNRRHFFKPFHLNHGDLESVPW